MDGSIIEPYRLAVLLVFIGLPLYGLYDARTHGASWLRVGVSGFALLLVYPIGVIASIATCVLARRKSRLNP